MDKAHQLWVIPYLLGYVLVLPLPRGQEALHDVGFDLLLVVSEVVSVDLVPGLEDFAVVPGHVVGEQDVGLVAHLFLNE